MVAAHRDQHRLTEQPAGTDAPVLGPFPTPDAGAAYANANVYWNAATVPNPSRGPRWGGTPRPGRIRQDPDGQQPRLRW